MTTRYPRMSGFALSREYAPDNDTSDVHLGQSRPQQYPQPLGPPLSIRGVAELLGCSPWTVRQRYIPQGLPHLRSGPSGKLIFFHNQVVLWILERQQQKGGIPR